MSLRRAAFLDRDGVLNEDRGYVYRSEDFVWLPGVFDALRRLQQADYALVVVTNQSGIARGFYTPEDLAALHHHMHAQLQLAGIALTGVYACPHHPEALLPAYRLDCTCRKPQPGLIKQAAQDHGLDLAASCLFGDKPSDLDAGRNAGVAHNTLVQGANGLLHAVNHLLERA
jgi:D-glycero-D-manno-heptose 1,7-bisphosphate phosphatase